MKNYPQIQAALKNTRSKVKVKKQRSSNIARIDKAFICNISNVAKQKGPTAEVITYIMVRLVFIQEALTC